MSQHRFHQALSLLLFQVPLALIMELSFIQMWLNMQRRNWSLSLNTVIALISEYCLCHWEKTFWNTRWRVFKLGGNIKIVYAVRDFEGLKSICFKAVIVYPRYSLVCVCSPSITPRVHWHQVCWHCAELSCLLQDKAICLVYSQLSLHQCNVVLCTKKN